MCELYGADSLRRPTSPVRMHVPRSGVPHLSDHHGHEAPDLITTLLALVGTEQGCPLKLALLTNWRKMANEIPIKIFFFSSRRRHTIFDCDWSSDVCSSD